MPSRLYQETQNNNLTNRIQQLKDNPAQYLMQSRFNVPQEYQQNPQDMVNYLVQSGQVSQDRVNGAMMLANRMGIKI